MTSDTRNREHDGMFFERRYDGIRVSMEISRDSTIDDCLVAFADFLRGCGYVFDGEVVIEPTEVTDA